MSAIDLRLMIDGSRDVESVLLDAQRSMDRTLAPTRDDVVMMTI